MILTKEKFEQLYMAKPIKLSDPVYYVNQAEYDALVKHMPHVARFLNVIPPWTERDELLYRLNQFWKYGEEVDPPKNLR